MEHKIGKHVSKLRGIAYNVPQTVCHDCGEIFLGPDSLEVIHSYKCKSQQEINLITS